MKEFMKDWKKKIQMLTYVFPAAAVLACSFLSLRNYEKPVFQVEAAEEDEVEEPVQEETAVLEEPAQEGKKKITVNKKVKLPAAQQEENEDSETIKTVAKITDADGYKNGIYYGTGTGFEGEIKVKVTIKKEKINKIEIVKSQDGEEYLKKASSLTGQMIKKQSTNVDAVSGATYSSNGLIEAVRNALKKAEKTQEQNSNQKTKKNTKKDTKKNTADKNKTADQTTDKDKSSSGAFPYKDGIYYGTGEGYRGDITAAVCISDHSIQYIMITKSSDDSAFLTKAKSILTAVVKKQSTDVDAVSGATFSSNGIIEAIKNALAKAKKKGTDASAGTTSSSESSAAPAGAVSTSETSAITEETTPVSGASATAAEGASSSDAAITAEGASSSDAAITTEVTSSSEAAVSPSETGNSETSVYADGEYQADVICSPNAYADFDAYTLSLKITLAHDTITSVTEVKGSGALYDSSNDWYIKRAVDGTGKYPGVAGQIVSKGTYEGVDAVSGATCSSKAILEAVKKALESAKK
jgi:uncharacterized protein with FMN-binding domain